MQWLFNNSSFDDVAENEQSLRTISLHDNILLSASCDLSNNSLIQRKNALLKKAFIS